MLDDGATQQEIADQAGLSQNCISRFLHGTNDISFSRGLKIMRVILAAQTMGQESASMSDGDQDEEVYDDAKFFERFEKTTPETHR